jgi:hypothetical protein
MFVTQNVLHSCRSLSFYILLLPITEYYYHILVSTKYHWNITFQKKFPAKYVVKNDRSVTHGWIFKRTDDHTFCIFEKTLKIEFSSILMRFLCKTRHKDSCMWPCLTWHCQPMKYTDYLMSKQNNEWLYHYTKDLSLIILRLWYFVWNCICCIWLLLFWGPQVEKTLKIEFSSILMRFLCKTRHKDSCMWPCLTWHCQPFKSAKYNQRENK